MKLYVQNNWKIDNRLVSWTRRIIVSLLSWHNWYNCHRVECFKHEHATVNSRVNVSTRSQWRSHWGGGLGDASPPPTLFQGPYFGFVQIRWEVGRGGGDIIIKFINNVHSTGFFSESAKWHERVTFIQLNIQTFYFITLWVYIYFEEFNNYFMLVYVNSCLCCIRQGQTCLLWQETIC